VDEIKNEESKVRDNSSVWSWDLTMGLLRYLAIMPQVCMPPAASL